MTIEVCTHLLSRGVHMVFDGIQPELMRTELSDQLTHSESLPLTNRRPSKLIVHRDHY